MTADLSAGAARSPATVEPTGEPAMSAAHANKRFYRENAERYDVSEFCVVDPAARRLLRDLLERGLALLTAAEPRVLDACGGSGNASEVLLDLGVTATLVDISPDMLSLWRQHASERGADPPIVEAEIASFLDNDDAEAWDLIVFSSALHHLDDYGATITAACRRLAPGGVLVTAFDPVPLGAVGQLFRKLDYAGHLAVTDARGFFERVVAKLRRSGSKAPNVGAVAEQHALAGIDDRAILDALADAGMSVVEHRRYFSGRLRVMRAAHRISRQPTSFSVIAQKELVEGRESG